MVAAAPNAGKSMFALVYAIKADVPTLFFSADTDIATVMLRTAAHISGHNQTLVEENLNKNSKYYDDKFDQVQNIQWVFDSSPSLDDIEMEIKAYIELYGIAPELIVIDNLMNVAAESDNEWAGLRQIMVELHDMARKTEAPAMILTLGYEPIGQQLRVAAVKNRFGRHTADGKDYITLFTNYGSCQISDADDYGRMLNRDARFESMRDKVG